MAERLAKKKSKEQWVYDKAMLESYAHFSHALDRMDELANTEDRVIDWAAFCRYWEHYMILSRMKLRCLARRRLRAARAASFAANGGWSDHIYSQLLLQHKQFWAPVELSAPDLRAVDARKQACALRGSRYAAMRLGPQRADE